MATLFQRCSQSGLSLRGLIRDRVKARRVRIRVRVSARSRRLGLG